MASPIQNANRYPLMKVRGEGCFISQMVVEMRSKRGFDNPNIRPDVKIRTALAYFDGHLKPTLHKNILLTVDLEKRCFVDSMGAAIEALNAEDMFKKVEGLFE